MNIETAKILCKLNTDFYRSQAASFAETRQSPWPGWRRCVEELQGSLPASFSVFDLACGNLRFEAFLAASLPQADITFYAVDNCDSLLPEAAPAVNYQSLDIVGELLEGASLNARFEAPPCDLSVSFGFLHHVPGSEQRQAVLESLISQTRPGGHVIVSLWQFMKNESMAEKARATHAQALAELGLPALEKNDYLLGWKNTPGAYRYCRNFTEPEIDALIESVASRATLTSRFTADGRTADLNTYLIFKVNNR